MTKSKIDAKKLYNIQMFSFLQKKIALQPPSMVSSCNWSKDNEWLAIGGTNGLLKIIKFSDPRNREEATSQGGLLENISLESHSGEVKIISWNEKYRKLTTADSNGLIVVYMRHHGQWIEEMINNRKVSNVAHMKWSPDGNKIGIIYEDGHVIIGGVQGNRKWGKEFAKKLALIDWSPDSKMLLLGTGSGEVIIYDQNGQELNHMRMIGLKKIVEPINYLNPKIPLASIEWFQEAKMYTDQAAPGLCIAYQCGRIILLKNDKDDDPIAIDSSMQISKVKWNPSGTIIVVAGSTAQEDQKKGIIKFFDSKGDYLRNMRIPNVNNVVDIAWQGSGLRLAIGAGSNTYCAIIKPNYKWCYLTNGTIVFGFQKMDRIDYCVVFWDTKNDAKFMKYVKDLLDIKGQGEYCAVYSRLPGDEPLCQIDLCNAIGTTLETKYVQVDLVKFCMSKTHIIATSDSYIYLWQYKNQNSKLTLFDASSLRKLGREVCWFIGDQKPDSNSIYDRERFDNTKETEDIITAVTANENALIIGLESGSIIRYNLPYISLEKKLMWKPLPSIISINSDTTRLCLIDTNGTLNIMEINNQGGTVLEFERKDTWCCKWSQDHPLQLSFIEKSKLTTVTDVAAQPPLPTEGYICSFSNLKVIYCYLDDIIKSSDENIKYEDVFLQHESEVLKNFNECYKKDGINAAVKYAEQNNHNVLWKLIAQKALEELDYMTAERALFKVDDYKTLRLIKRIQTLDDRNKQKAAVLAFYGKYDDAEQIYKQIERKDLAIQMRVKIGDWYRVLQMVREGSGYDDTLQQITDQLGDYYAQKFKWDKAAEFYLLSKNYKGLIEAFTRIEDYQSLAQIITEIPQNDPMLLDLAEKFQAAGIAEYAVKCYQRAEQGNAAIDCCILLNHWGLAMELAEKYGFVQIELLLQQYANSLLSKNRRIEAAQLYRKANRNTEAAKILSQIANDLIDRQSKPIYIKKLYVMAALQVDLYKKRLIDSSMTGQQGNTTMTLNSLITSDINTSSDKILNNPWRGGEAWHFYILCQRQLYGGQFKAALKTALRLTEYELDLDAKKIYTLVALSAYYNKSYKECSRAFVKLQGMGSPEEGELYQEVAVSIFTKHPPKESSKVELFGCPAKNCKNQVTEYETSCKSCGSNFPPCMLTGRSILTKEYYTCKMCRHKMIQSEIEAADLKCCSLCHSPVDYRKLGIQNAD